ncbi:MAG TPA: alpha/beta hydrolase [Pyrinomonadaceae bacterium]
MKKRYLAAGISGVVAGAVATKLLTRPRDVSWPDSIDLIPHPEHSWFTRVGGVRIHYQDAGDQDAPALILIHGFISSTLIWNDVFLPLAAAGFRVIALDLPGYGYSDKPVDGRYTIDAQAYAVISLMNRLEIDEATIVGASYGGAVAATMALDYPERVTRLVLIGAVTNDDPMRKLVPRIAQLPLVGDVVTPLFLGSRWVLRKRMEDTYRRSGRPLDEHKLAARHHLLATAASQRAMLRTIRRWNANRISREAHLIRKRTLILWGEDDRHIPLSDGVRLREAIAGARLIVFRDCGHLPPVEQPERFVKVVTQFCQEEEARNDAPIKLKPRSEPPAVADAGS